MRKCSEVTRECRRKKASALKRRAQQYNDGDWKDLEDKLEKLIEEKEMQNITIGGDFNLRIGNPENRYGRGKYKEEK